MHRLAVLAISATLFLAACNQTRTTSTNQPVTQNPDVNAPVDQQPGSDNPGSGGSQQPPSGGTQNPPSGGTTQPGGPSGTLVTNFGTNGISRLSLGASNYRVQELAVRSDNKFVALVMSSQMTVSGGIEASYLVRANADGSLDTRFGTSGRVTLPELSTQLALEADGSILVAGGSTSIRHYNSGGAPDASFGSGGSITPEGSVNDLTAQSDGKILTVSQITGATVVHRYQMNGQPDASFGSGGRVALSSPQTNSAGDARWNYPSGSIKVAPNGSIYLGAACGLSIASTNWYPNTAFCVAKLSNAGQVDTTYGNYSGVAIFDAAKYNHGDSLAVQADGRAVIAGATGYGASWTVIRVSADGKSREVFANTFTSSGAPSSLQPATLIDASGRVVVAGFYMLDSTNSRLVVARFNADGTLDTSFANGGKLDVLPADTRGAAFTAAFTNDGAILGGGWAARPQDSNQTDAVLVKVWQ